LRGIAVLSSFAGSHGLGVGPKLLISSPRKWPPLLRGANFGASLGPGKNPPVAPALE